jgi:hypothetical protein
MINIFQLIFFVFFVLFSHFSIIGYGLKIKLFFNFNHYSNEKNFEKLIEFFIGIIFLTMLGFIFYVFSITNYYINLLVLLFGLMLYLIERKNYTQTIELNTFLLLAIMFVGILISKTHEDYIPYHFKYIDIISNSKFVLGLGNLETTFIYASFFSYLQKFFVMPFFNYKLLHVPIFLIFFNICLFLILQIINNKKFNIINLLLLLLFLTKFSRMSEYGYDYISGFILLLIMIIFYFVKDKSLKQNPSLILLLFIYAISIKITALFFFPIFLLLFYISFKETNNSLLQYLMQNIRGIIPCFVLLFFIIFDNFSRSGCVFYFIEFTCLDQSILPWAIDYKEIIEFTEKVNLAVKGYNHQSIITNDPELFLKFKSWFPIWYQNYFYYKISEFIILLIFLSVLIICHNNKIFKKTIDQNSIKRLLLLLFSIISIVFWIMQLPLLRFGFFTIIAFYIFLIGFFLDIDKNHKINNFTYALIITALLFYTGNNIKRIKNEFDRSDRYKFINFPFESRTNYTNEKKFSDRYLHIKKNKYYFFDYIGK